MKLDRLRDIRESLELTQADVAKIMKVHRSTFSGWETGKDSIPLQKLNKLCNFYNVSIDYATGLSNNSKNNYKVNNINPKNVGKNLKILRKQNNLVQKDIFLPLNTTSSTYSAYETGKVLIKTDFLYAIAKKYNSSMDLLIGKKD